MLILLLALITWKLNVKWAQCNVEYSNTFFLLLLFFSRCLLHVLANIIKHLLAIHTVHTTQVRTHFDYTILDMTPLMQCQQQLLSHATDPMDYPQQSNIIRFPASQELWHHTPQAALSFRRKVNRLPTDKFIMKWCWSIQDTISNVLAENDSFNATWNTKILCFT